MLIKHNKVSTLHAIRFFGFLSVILLLLTPLITVAQDAETAEAEQTETVADSLVAGNTAIKSVFKEAKQIVKGDESTLLSILMICLVLTVVGIALWLSFKSPSSSEKRQRVLQRQRKRES
jgi:hypothetical protein